MFLGGANTVQVPNQPTTRTGAHSAKSPARPADSVRAYAPTNQPQPTQKPQEARTGGATSVMTFPRTIGGATGMPVRVTPSALLAYDPYYLQEGPRRVSRHDFPTSTAKRAFDGEAVTGTRAATGTPADYVAAHDAFESNREAVKSAFEEAPDPVLDVEV